MFKKVVLYPLAYLFKWAVDIKNWLYENKMLSIYKTPVKVISVGNITVGGTGKTPVINHLAQWMQSKNISFGIVSRGYKGHMKEGSEVLLNAGSSYWGDEPMMLKQKNPKVPIFTGGDRVKVIDQLKNKYPIKWVLADDAFQHRRLHRDINIVILDATEKLDNYQPMPLGRARESFKDLERADYIILTKVNNVNFNQVNELKALIKSEAPKTIPFIEAAYEIKNLVNVHTGEIKSSDFVFKRDVLLVSALGKADSFEQMILALRANVVRHMQYPDHHFYTEQDMSDIGQQKDKLKVDIIITTQKDAIKLNKFDIKNGSIWYADLSLSVSESVNQIYEDIIRKNI